MVKQLAGVNALEKRLSGRQRTSQRRLKSSKQGQRASRHGEKVIRE
jgi:hypothetical protein